MEILVYIAAGLALIPAFLFMLANCVLAIGVFFGDDEDE